MLVAHDNGKVVAGFLWCRKKKFTVKKKKERLVMVVSAVSQEMG